MRLSRFTGYLGPLVRRELFGACLPTLTRSELSWRYGCWILLQPLSNLSLRAGSHHKDLGDLPRFLRSCAR
jgi:hypothetical protein